MFKVKDSIGKEIDTEFWLEEDEDQNAIFLRTKLTTDLQNTIIARIDKNGISFYASFCQDFGFKTIKKENSSMSYINICYPHLS